MLLTSQSDALQIAKTELMAGVDGNGSADVPKSMLMHSSTSEHFSTKFATPLKAHEALPSHTIFLKHRGFASSNSWRRKSGVGVSSTMDPVNGGRGEMVQSPPLF